jgi:dihydrofolate reductase
MTTISLIVAMANDRVIGIDNTLPWRLSADLKRFKATTMGKPIIMGRKTWDSIGRPLPGRLNIVISRNGSYPAEGAKVVTSLEAAIALAKQEGTAEIMIMGGANIYQQAMPLVDKMYITMIDLDIEGDAWFPEYDAAQWRVEQEESCHQEAISTDTVQQVAFDYRFVDLSKA